MLFWSLDQLSFSQLHQKFDLPSKTFFLYLRIRSILSKISWTSANSLSQALLKFYNSNHTKIKRISLEYKMLTAPTPELLSSSIRYWSIYLDHPPSTELWQKALRTPSHLFHCTSHWKSLLKLFHRWYYLPDRLAKIYSSTSPNCWRGCDSRGSLHHIWWECPHIKNYWKKVMNLIYSLCDISNVPTRATSGAINSFLAQASTNLGNTHTDSSPPSSGKNMEINSPSCLERHHLSAQPTLPNVIFICQGKSNYKFFLHLMGKMDRRPEKCTPVLKHANRTNL